MAAITGTVIAGAAVANSAYQGKKNRDQARSLNRQGQWVGEAQQDLIGRAQQVADRPYEEYEGKRIADLSANEQSAINMARDRANGTNSLATDQIGKAIGQVDEVAGSDWNEETAKKYMDPYIGQVVNNSLSRENDAYQKRVADVRGNAARIGAFGGDRATLLESSETDAHLRNVGELTASGYSDAFKNASSMWQADNNRRLAAADAYRAAGGDIHNMESSQIQDLLRTGGADRVLRQAGSDFEYEQFLERRDWEPNNLQALFQATGNANGGVPQQPVPRDQTAGQLLGLASTLVGYFGQQQGGAEYTTGYQPAGGIGAGGGTAPVTYDVIGAGSGSMNA